MGVVHNSGKDLLADGADVLELDAAVTKCLRDDAFPAQNFGVPLAGRCALAVHKSSVSASCACVPRGGGAHTTHSSSSQICFN